MTRKIYKREMVALATKVTQVYNKFCHSFFAAADCLEPTEKNSVMTSRGMPFVSGTFRYTNTQEMQHTTA